jgi:DNA-binding LacI/PurR family transcriptional regulator
MTAASRVSIKDIAKAAGVSYSTVSRALNDSPLISQEVRSRIQEMAQTMGYTPNALAQSLLSRLTHSIGLVITTISDPFFVDVVKGVEEVAREAEISVFLATSDNDPEKEIKIIETFNRRRVDGVIVAASQVGVDYANRLEEIHIPVVMINNQAAGEYKNLYSIAVDDFSGGRLAVQYLTSLGHRRIGYIGMNNRPGSNDRRYKGYLASLEEIGIAAQQDLVYFSETTSSGDFSGDIKTGQSLAPRLLEKNVSAIFCYCDTVAAGALLACRHLGVAVPEQASIIGFDDNDLCEIVSPSLTTIRQPKRVMGQMAMEMLLKCISGGFVTDSLLKPTLVVRQSTASPPDFK